MSEKSKVRENLHYVLAHMSWGFLSPACKGNNHENVTTQDQVSFHPHNDIAKVLSHTTKIVIIYCSKKKQTPTTSLTITVNPIIMDAQKVKKFILISR